MSYEALHEKKSLSAWFTAMEKSCMVIPTHTSKVMRGQPQPRENSNIERKPVPVASHATGCLCSIQETYATILQRDLSYSDEEIRIFY